MRHAKAELVGVEEGKFRLSPDKLRWNVDPARVLQCSLRKPEETLPGIIGQTRAVSSLRFGLGIRDPGFHIYVAGPPGIGKMTALRLFLDEAAKDRPAPDDWCYVHNFEDPQCPRLIRTPSGMARALRTDMERLLEHLHGNIPKAFDSEEYANKRGEILEEFKKERARIMNLLQREAQRLGFELGASPFGVFFNPAGEGAGKRKKSEGSADASSADQRREELEQAIKTKLRELHEFEKSTKAKLKELDRQIAMFTFGALMDQMRVTYKGQDAVLRYLSEVQEDILNNIEAFKKASGASEGPSEDGEQMQWSAFKRAPHMHKYTVNVIVDNAGLQGAPVVIESDPWFGRLFGVIEKEGLYGSFYTDFTLIKAGALQRANGGFLVLPAEELLRNPFCWDALKRSLKERRVRMEPIEERMGWSIAKSLRPEVMPLDVKIILVGNAYVHYLLQTYDEDFSEIFRVKAEFDTRTPNDEAGIGQILEFLDILFKKEGLLPMAAGGAAKMLEYAARLAESRTHLSVHFGALSEVAREANHWAKSESADHIEAAHVTKALQERVYRTNLMETRLREMVKEGTILLDLSGRSVGQVNGLSVMQLGDYAFGRPSRITASVGPGREGLVDIEREVELSGPIHSKGVLILNGYLVHRYSQTRPLTLSARLVFEQSYAGVEGDSASSAELYALLSALSGLPLKQGIAVTGSVSQHGEVQAIGAVNEKIEGFFDACRAAGLTGKQGVVIPASNLDHLMLREDVVEAARSGLFHVWAVRTVDEGIEILTGVPAGSPLPSGHFPEGTVNYLVEEKMKQYARLLRQEGRETHHHA